VIQGGREAVLRPGHFALYDTTIPYTLLFAEGIDQHFFRIPREALALPSRSLHDLMAVTLGVNGRVRVAAGGRIAVSTMRKLTISW
jgi:AraC-like protein